MQKAPLTEIIPAKLALHWRVLPLDETPDGRVRVAAADAENLEQLENLSALLGAPVQAEAWAEEEIRKAIETRYGVGADAVDDLRDEIIVQPETPAVEAQDAAMIRFVDDLLRQAQSLRATDVHIEPFDQELRVRFRVDGLLHAAPVPATLTRFRSQLASRIKIMADLDIAETRLPQDGRIRFRSDSDELDIRVSTVPTVHGESIDLRLLPRTRLSLGLEELGMEADHRDVIASLIRKPNGIILVTGPTGHGKTTTLYACLSKINSVEKKIVTIEDPVEMRLRGINQIQVHQKIGLSFANGLRSVLRQDPDVIMVGEIRDKDTADIAIRASLTGHLVFSTLHTNDAVGAITRLTDMGIEPYLAASSIRAVLAQRLVRLCCDRCTAMTRHACDACRQTGFRGRTGIFELFLIDDDLRALIVERTSHTAIRRAAIARGMRTLFEDGRARAAAGATTLDEVLRVTEELS